MSSLWAKLLEMESEMARKYDKSLAVIVRHYDNCVTVNLERGARGITVRLYPQNDGETQKSARDFASLLADFTNANWQVIHPEVK